MIDNCIFIILCLRSANKISCRLRGVFLSKSTMADASDNVDYPRRNRN